MPFEQWNGLSNALGTEFYLNFLLHFGLIDELLSWPDKEKIILLMDFN